MEKSQECLYYYCSSQVLLSLLQKKELWLTALDLSNDHLEGKWALDRYVNLLPRVDHLGRRQTARILLENGVSSRVALGMCFSKERDLLSQWRGYAANGRGVCVSFKRGHLEEAIGLARPRLPGVDLIKVAYGQIHSELVSEISQAFFDQYVFAALTDEVPLQVSSKSKIDHEQETRIIRELFKYKNPAFEEEGEWRILFVQFATLTKELEYRETRDIISPFVRFPFEIDAIESITLGPRHPTPESRVKELLVSLNCGARVLKSSASYVER